MDLKSPKYNRIAASILEVIKKKGLCIKAKPFFECLKDPYAGVTLLAQGPFLPCPITKSTF